MVLEAIQHFIKQLTMYYFNKLSIYNDNATTLKKKSICQQRLMRSNILADIIRNKENKDIAYLLDYKEAKMKKARK